SARVLKELDGHIVAARQDNMLVTSFHPELTDDTSVHEYFIRMAAAYKNGLDK
ncbi:MAG: pyridoxal 5'-phosphate synthase glutaminase subunit PdxT, partial [Clostridiales bacterium]|nr:pyridoxal 5'-phosphate synthase glutaminase subunit PdxT [Clostridiales bacterium]